MLLVLLILSLALTASAGVAPNNLGSDLTILITNDLLEENSPNSGTGMLLLDSRSLPNAAANCAALGEKLWGSDVNASLVQKNLDYIVYTGKYKPGQMFWIAPDSVENPRTIDTWGVVSVVSRHLHLPALCTNSAPYSSKTAQNSSSPWQVTVHSNNEYITGFRDRLAFRFLGIRYAPNPERFGYSEVYKGQAKNKTALAYSVECMRPNGKGSEDCLFINVWSPYLPAHGGAPKDNLKPVMFWIHGGAFTGGTHNDPVFDGSNISSRGDVILVAVNYRLGTLGFLALDDAVANGNYGLQDQITALEWVRRNIHNFGGDPDRITIFGQSAGAASVRALLASPKAKGKFAGAIMMSSLGGTNYGESYSKYYSITEEVGLIARPILNAANCTNSSSQLDCLRSLPAATVAALTPAARFLVVDGVYLKGDGLRVNGSVPVENVPLMIGTMRDDGAAFIKWQGTENLTTAVITEEFPLSALASGLFPQPHSDNITLDVFNVTARISTDAMFRCVDQATAYAGVSNSLFPVVYYYEFNRSYQLTSYNPNPPVCNAPTTTENPNGDPAGEYFKCHSGELYYVFGNLLRQGVPLRDEYDLPFEQFTLDTWASFARTFNPNPDMEFLRARGYENTIAELHAAGEWKPVEKDKPTYRRLQWPSVQESCVELAQCENLGFSLNFLAH